MPRQQTVQEYKVNSTFGRVMDELSPILIKIETKSRYGDEKEMEDADALFHEYLKYRSDDMKKDLDGETIYSLAERFINFEASDEKHQKEEEYQTAVERITGDYESAKNKAESTADKEENEVNAPVTVWNALKAVVQRAAPLATAYFGSKEIIAHSEYKDYVDGAIAITFAVWTGIEGYAANKKAKKLAKIKDKKAKAEQAALSERDLKFSRARTWMRTSSRHVYQLADLRRERIYKLCAKGAEGFPKQDPVERDDEMRATFGLWLPPVDKYIMMDIDVSEEIKRKAEKLKEEAAVVGACT